METDGDLQTLLSDQRRELTAAQAIESDLDLAIQLQMEEAMNASLSSNANSSLAGSSNPIIFDSGDNSIPILHAEEIDKYEQEYLDSQIAEAEMKKIQDDLNRRIHDHAFARELQNIPSEEWWVTGDNIETSYGEGSLLGKHVTLSSEDSFKVHVKGLIREEVVGGSGRKSLLAGIGVAICDMDEQLVLEVTKGLFGDEISGEVIEMKAAIEGLNVATMLGLKRIRIFTCCNYTFQCISGKCHPKDNNLATLLDQFTVMSRKLNHCDVSLVGETHLRFALALAQDALASQARQALRNNSGKHVVENCAICVENMSLDQMFQINGCSHRYCFSCMRTYVQVKLFQSRLPRCPHEGCKSELKVDDCKKFLTPELLDILSQRIKEASIDPAEKIYCPYATCSALMSRSEIQGTSGGVRTSVNTCTKCSQRFCISCKVPWHENMTCRKYKKLNPHPLPEDLDLNSLATKSHWRQCPKCNHMVSLGGGCNHVSCRCGHEFCYVCGGEWKNKRATCGCALWDERNIIYDDPNRHQRRRGNLRRRA